MTVGLFYVLSVTCVWAGLALAFLGPDYVAKRRKERREISPDYDRMINTLIDGDMFELESSHTIKAGLLRVWIENYPYSYGHPYNCGVPQDLKISMKTKKRLHEYVQRKSVLSALEKVKRA